MSGSRLVTAALGVAAAACAIGAAVWWASADRMEFYTGAGVQNASVSDHEARDILWRSPERLGEAFEDDAESFEGSVPSGGPTANNELLFARVSADGDTDLYSAERVGREWSAPRPIAALNTLHNEQSPRLSPEGAWLYFTSDRPGGEGGLDLWKSPRTSGGWGDPINLGPEINTRDNEAHAVIDPGSGALWFASDRERVVVAVESEDDTAPASDGGFDLYRASRDGVELVESVSSLEDDVAPAFSPVGDFVYFASSREGGAGGLDLYRARVTKGTAGALRSLGAPVNTAGDELDPAPASEGFELFYTSVDDEGVAGFLRTVSREVELTRDVRYGDLAALMRLLPWILLVLAIVLLLSMLRRLAKGGAAGASLGALSLMAKCVLVSLVLHAILLALLSLWMVEPEEGQLAEADSGTRVSLTSSSIRSSLESQVRDTAGDPVEVTAEDIADNATPTPVDAIAATPESAAPAPTQEINESPLSRAVAQTDAASAREISRDVAEPALSAREATELSVNTPTAARARRVDEAWARIDSALESPSAAPLEYAPTSENAVAASVEPAAREGDERPIERAVREATVGASVAGELEPLTPAENASSTELALHTPEVARARRASEPETGIAAPDFQAREPIAPPTTSPAFSLATPAPQTAELADQPRVARPEPEADASSRSTRAVLPDALPNTVDAELSFATPGATANERAVEAGVNIDLERVAPRRDEPTPARSLSVEAPAPESAIAGDAPRRARPTASAPELSPATRLDLSTPAIDTPLAELALPGAVDSDEPVARAERDVELALQPADAPLRKDAPSVAVVAPLSATIPVPTETVRDDLRRPDPIDAPAPRSGELAELGVPSAAARTPDLRLPIATPIPVEPDALSGTVLDAVTSEPIAGARVRLDLAEEEDASATSGDDGAFVLRAFDIPDNSAISASARGYIPYSANITADELEAGATAVILLWPESLLTVALEEDPEVHHLGNDAFTGRVNSQFQRRAEGLTIELPFSLSEEQLPPNTNGATLLMLAKGVQLDNRFYLNGRRLNVTFPASPRDGSFGEVAVELPMRLFREGFNTLGIESVRRGDTDYDDFEFVNVRVQFIPANVIID